MRLHFHPTLNSSRINQLEWIARRGRRRWQRNPPKHRSFARSSLFGSTRCVQETLMVWSLASVFVQELLGTVKKVPNLSGTKILHLRKSLYDLYACSVLGSWNSRYWISLKFNAPLSCYLSRWMVVSVALCTCARMLLCMHGWMWRAGDGIHAIFVKNQSWWIPKMSWSTSVSTAESSWLP